FSISHRLGLATKGHKMHTKHKLFVASLCAIILMIAATLSIPVAAAQSKRPLTPILFDDFNYTNHRQLKKNGWIVRTVPGWPGVPGAKWLDANVTLLKDPGNSKNRILRMTSSTDGTPENTTQTQICQQRKFFEGTYAAR